MTSPRPGEGRDARATCLEPHCGRPVVHSALVCRTHFAEAMRREGRTIPYTDPDMAGLYAAAVHIVRSAVEGLSEDLLRAPEPSAAIDMYALLEPDAEWAKARIAMDTLGCQLLDQPPFGSWVKLVPRGVHGEDPPDADRRTAKGVDELCPRLEVATEAMVREAIGWESPVQVSVGPVEEADESVA